jgi:nucleotide-binding universal stress UspA family protein
MAALEAASSLARAFRASLEILSVIEGGEAEDDGTERTERIRAASADLACGESPRIVVRSGKPSEEILAEAAARDIDLIVMGSRGLSPVEQITLGSIAESAIQNANCPVLVVKEHLVPGSGDSGPDARALETTARPMR